MKRLILGCILVVLAHGCAASNTHNETAANGVSRSLDSLSFERTPCFGTCPTYLTVMRANLSGTFLRGPNAKRSNGESFIFDGATWRIMNERYFGDISSLDTAYVFGSSVCSPYVTDAPGGVLTAYSAETTRRLVFDRGCAHLPAAIERYASFLDSIAAVDQRLR